VHTRSMKLALALGALMCSAPSFAEEVTPAEGIEAVKGNPPADHPFAKLTPGMSFDEAVAILGKPTGERSYCTGKHRIPFYMARDKAYTEYYYKGQGKVYFYTRVSTFSAFHGAVNSCTPKDPFELAGAEFNPGETGEVPPEGK